jgi:DNA processing protein
MKEARLQIAFGGLHPDRVRGLLAEFGPGETQRRLASGSIRTTARVRQAVAVPAGVRIAELARCGIGVVWRGESGYPEILGVLPDAPDLLFVRGSIPQLPAVAVVGTRRCTSYGSGIAEAYGRAIAGAGWPVVSGLARGIDGAAHRGTVDTKGRGVAVLGSGIDVMYPREHGRLARDLITCGGAVVSESPPGTPPEAWRFPPRNRIISGLAGAVVVVEATVKGGARITAEAALGHGRQVFAVPGDIGRASSAGCNLLIRDGAFPVHDPDDLLESLELVLGAPPRTSSSPNKEASGRDREVIELIAGGLACADDLLAALDLGVGAGLAYLGELEMRGLIRPDGPGRYGVA